MLKVEESLASMQESIANFISFLWIDLWEVIPLVITRKSLCSSLGSFAPTLKKGFQIRGLAAMLFQLLLVGIKKVFGIS